MWVNSQIADAAGTLRPGSLGIADSSFGGFVLERAEMSLEAHRRTAVATSARQGYRIRERGEKNRDRTEHPHVFRALQFDADVVRQQAAAQRFDRVGRNAPCPCASQKKFKKCHGS